MSDQPSIFDAPRAVAERDRSIDAVERNAASDWAELAYRAVARVARFRPTFIVDDVWVELARLDPAASTHENRAMGAVMRRAVREGLIAPTSEYRPSDRATCHRNPRRVWRSIARARGT